MKTWICFAVSLLSACAASDPRCPSLPEGGHYCLQPLAANAPFHTQQKAEIRHKDRGETMLASIESDERALNFVGLSPFGQKLLQLQCTDTASTATLSPSDQLDPAVLCALLQWTFWPTDSVRAGLQTPLRLEDDGPQRKIHAGDRLIFSALRIGARPSFQRIELRLPTLEMMLDIETLPEAAAP